MSPSAESTRSARLVEHLVLEAERQTQQLTAWIRLGLGVVVATMYTLGAPVEVRLAPIPYLLGAYFALSLLSLALSRGALFRAWHATMFVCLDVIWLYGVMFAGVVAFELPFGHFAALPPFLIVFFLLALAGMRYTWWALAAGLVTFAVCDAAILAAAALGWLPIPLLGDDPLFGGFANVMRVVIIAATAGVLALGAWRNRRTLFQTLVARGERDFIRAAFGRYVPDSIASAIVNDHGALQPVQRTATILFTDIEGFTSIVERMEPARVIDMLNAYFSEVERAISAEGGVITQFQGDAVLATFNLPVAQADHADRALRAARAIARFTGTRSFAGERLATRIGLNTGPVVGGAVGGAERVGYTVHGDAVNVAARLETKNKDLGTHLLVADTTFALLCDTAGLTEVGAVEVRGKHGAITVYTTSPRQIDPAESSAAAR